MKLPVQLLILGFVSFLWLAIVIPGFCSSPSAPQGDCAEPSLLLAVAPLMAIWVAWLVYQAWRRRG